MGDGLKRFARVSLTGTLLLALLAGAAPVLGQTAAVAVDEENFRAEPGGAILAELLRGTLVTLGGSQGQWREATVEAWIWGRSVAVQDRPELELLVNASGENLRASPNGERIGRALGGMRLDRLETRGDWIRARRTGWIWFPSVEMVEGALGEEGASTAQPAAPSRSGGSSREFAAVSGSAHILSNPAGDTVARLRPGANVEVLAREGDWSRVRVEGWTYTGTIARDEAGSTAILADLPRDSLDAHPERYRGRLVEWSLQFIALQEAERFRTDFLQGEPYLLTRGPGEDPGFVYVAVPPDRRGEVESLSPLQRIRILARIRSARSALTGAPVLDLLEITGR